MSRLFVVLALAFVCSTGLSAQTAPSPSEDGLTGVLADLQSVADDLADNQKQIDELHSKIADLQTLGKDSAVEIARLQTLVDAHAARGKELGQRYTKVLGIAQKLKHDLELSALCNYIFGGVAAAAVIVAVGEGVVLASR